MSHYFSENSNNIKSNEVIVHVKIRDKEFKFYTDHGVFSRKGLDFGSRLLIESVLDESSNQVLDLGCGYGPIGIIYKAFIPKADVFMLDINNRAVDLSKKNSIENKVKVNIEQNDSLENINMIFDLILTNPPIRAGKSVVYKFFKESYNHLCPGGKLVFVMNKKHGAQSAKNECEKIFASVEVVNKKSGYYIIRCRK